LNVGIAGSPNVKQGNSEIEVPSSGLKIGVSKGTMFGEA